MTKPAAAICRLVIPAVLREPAGLVEGRPVVLLDTPKGIVLVTREQLKELVRADLSGLDLVTELLRDRSRDAAAEDVA